MLLQEGLLLTKSTPPPSFPQLTIPSTPPVMCAPHSSPTDGSQVAVSAEVAVPARPSWLGFTRLRMRAEQPVSLGPLDVNFRVKAGGVHGDLPPYEAFPLGGTNSVRGYAEGGVGSGRHFVEGSAELR